LNHEQQLGAFVAWCKQHIKGDEKGEAQIFLDRLFTALGYPDGLKGAEAVTEQRIKFTLDEKSATRFADLVIPGRVLIEMKKRSEDLARHQLQALDYWKYLTPHPPYIVLCNFDEFWVYDMERQVDHPMAKLPLEQLPKSWGALAFLFPQPQKPVFTREFDLVELTQDAARSLSLVFQRLADPKRGLERDQAQRFILQCMLALFAEDIELLPRYTFTRVIEECQAATASSYDLFQLLFTAMNRPGVEKGGRFFGVDYFNGGLFSQINPIELTAEELRLLREAADRDWGKIRPAIFGTIFEGSMELDERHQVGAHFTSERDILRIVEPVIVRPWREQMDAAQDAAQLRSLHTALCAYQVLDPACGSGNFLYVAYREMKRLEKQIFNRIEAIEGKIDTPVEANETPSLPAKSKLTSRATYVGPENPYKIPETTRYPERLLVSLRQFHGFDVKPFAVELAKVTLMIAKKLAIDELELPENALPLDTLDKTIRCEDALLTDWPEFDACIGNPPYLGAKRMKQEHPAEYINRVRETFPDVPGNADYCVYWFNKAHKLMHEGARAGLVGTNTIRQNYSREGGLDIITANDGHIFEAVSSMPWSGEAKVHVSITCWSKGDVPFRPRLWLGDGETVEEVDVITSSLSDQTDVSGAKVLACNTEPKRVFQGQTPGHSGFILSPDEAHKLTDFGRNSLGVVLPYLTGDDMLSQPEGKPSRYIIDFGELDISQAKQFHAAFRRLEQVVLPDLKQKALIEQSRNELALKENPQAKINRHHQGALQKWWQHFYSRADRKKAMGNMKRYIACSRVTKRPIFDLVDAKICPSDALQTFTFNDDYSFSILQSDVHWQWFTTKASTLKSDFRYTPNSVYDTFPWPQNPSVKQVKAIAEAGRKLHEYRRDALVKNPRLTLRELYRLLELPGKNPLKDLHAALDKAVLAAYGFDDGDVLTQLLALNAQVAGRIDAGASVTAPGIPNGYPNPAELVSEGCITPPEWV